MLRSYKVHHKSYDTEQNVFPSRYEIHQLKVLEMFSLTNEKFIWIKVLNKISYKIKSDPDSFGSFIHKKC